LGLGILPINFRIGIRDFRFVDSGFWIGDLGLESFGFLDFGFLNWDFRFKILDLRFWILYFGIWILDSLGIIIYV